MTFEPHLRDEDGGGDDGDDDDGLKNGVLGG